MVAKQIVTTFDSGSPKSQTIPFPIKKDGMLLCISRFGSCEDVGNCPLSSRRRVIQRFLRLPGYCLSVEACSLILHFRIQFCFSSSFFSIASIRSFPATTPSSAAGC